MIVCSASGGDTFRCPTKWELWRQIMALLPRGRAWQTHEATGERIVASESAQAGAYELGSTGLGTEPVVDHLTVMQRFWAAYAAVLEHMHARVCALIEEFYCSTAADTLPEWATEYGFPDTCEPWNSLCDKVRAQGGATCVYLASLAARVGYTIECIDCGPDTAEAGCAESGVAVPCICPPNRIIIRVISSASPAMTAVEPFEAGNVVAGCTDPCPPAVSALVCLIERYKPAHVAAVIEVI
jgi:uncharacterized protein YmfQ (DUF2313 family)